MKRDYRVISEYMNGTRVAKTILHRDHQYWGVILEDTATSKGGFIIWHPTKSEYWVEDIAENFCQGMLTSEGEPA